MEPPTDDMHTTKGQGDKDNAVKQDPDVSVLFFAFNTYTRWIKVACGGRGDTLWRTKGVRAPKGFPHQAAYTIAAPVTLPRTKSSNVTTGKQRGEARKAN